MALDAAFLERESIAGTAATELAEHAAEHVALGFGTTSISIVATTGTDISASIIAAQATLGAAGGKIILPKGTFFVQNVPLIDGIYYEGAGETATQLKLPNGATSSMFIASADLTIGWGFRNIYFSGIYNSTLFGAGNGGGAFLTRSTLNCLDASAATNVVCGNLENCWFEYFNTAYNGPQASGTNLDLYLSVINCRFQYNNIGAYFSEHLQILGTFFSMNGTTNGAALTGGGAITGRLNDCIVRTSYFVSNYRDVYPAAGKQVINTQFIGTLFCNQTLSGLTINESCVVSGCSFWANSAVTSYAIICLFGNHTITGNKFNETGASYVGGCIQFNDSGNAITLLNFTISANYFRMSDAAAGPCLNFNGLTNGGSGVRGMSVVGNTGLFNRTQFVKCNLFYSSEISYIGNSFYCNGDYTTGTPIALIEMYTGEGNTFVGNTIVAASAANKCNVLGGVISSTLVNSNTFRTFNGATMNVFLSGGIGSSITGLISQNNKGYVTRNSGTATLTAATSVVVTHGLANTPNIQDIVLTSQSAAIALPPYVSTVTSTQFTINYPGLAVTGNIGWIASCNN